MMQGKEGGVDVPLSPEAEEQPLSLRKKKSCKSKKRFSDEQVRSLESIFESEAKLEPRKKVQVARELGLQPRQVAIWFQNKRARWKSKQIEKSYRLLKANFDNLKARFDTMRKEKESLLQQLQELRILLEKTHERSHEGYKDFGSNVEYMMSGSENGAFFAKSSTLKAEEIDQQGQGEVTYSDGLDKTRGSMAYLCQQLEVQPQLVNASENNISINGGSIISPMKWCGFDATGALFDQSASTISHWWESSWT